MTIFPVEQRIQSPLASADHVIILECGCIAWSDMSAVLAKNQEIVEELLGVNGIH